MGNITLEQIDLIMQRTQASYSEAKEALEQADGDILEALLLIEKKEKFSKKTYKSNTEKITSFIDNLNNTTFMMIKGDRTYIDVPLSIAIIMFILCFYVSFIALIISLIMGVRIQIKGENEIARKIKSTFDDFTK